MSVFSICTFVSALRSQSAPGSELFRSHLALHSLSRGIEERFDGRSTDSRRFVVLSTHSNPRILKVNRKSRYGRPLSPFDSDDDDESIVDEDEDEEDLEEDWSDEVRLF